MIGADQIEDGNSLTGIYLVLKPGENGSFQTLGTVDWKYFPSVLNVVRVDTLFEGSRTAGFHQISLYIVHCQMNLKPGTLSLQEYCVKRE